MSTPVTDGGSGDEPPDGWGGQPVKAEVIRLGVKKARLKAKGKETKDTTPTKMQRTRTRIPDAEADRHRATKFADVMPDHLTGLRTAASDLQDKFAKFSARRDVLDIEGAYRDHNNDETPENARFKKIVHDYREGLKGYITAMVNRAAEKDMDFNKADRRYPGQQFTFTIHLDRMYTDPRYKKLTITGGVYAGRINVFHAGPIT